MSASPRALAREDFPALVEFARGYLHEDYLVTHGSAVAAAEAFCLDANDERRRQLAREFDDLLGRVEALDLDDVRAFVTRELGSRWSPPSTAALARLAEVVRPAGDP